MIVLITCFRSIHMTAPDDHPNHAPRLLLHGLDSLYACYYFDLASSKIDFDELEYRKQLAKEREDTKAIIELGGERLQVKGSGAYPYRYVLVNKDFSLALAERMHPSLKVQFFSEALWRDGAQALHNRIMLWAKALGVTVLKPEQIIRADWAFDFELKTIDFTEDHFVTRAKKNSKWRDGQTVQTFSFGTGDTVLRVYDKVAEIENASSKAWFYDLWGAKENVWRVEFQIRSERLKAAAIKTLIDLEDLQGDLLEQLALTHTTLRRPNGDSNRARWPMHPLWVALRGGIEALPKLGLCRHYDPMNSIEYRLIKNAQSLYGNLKGLAALTTLRKPSQGIPTLDETLEALRGVVMRFHSDLLWEQEAERRIRLHEVGQW